MNRLDRMDRMRYRRATGSSIALALVICSSFLGAAYAGRANHHPISLKSGGLNGYRWNVVASRDSGKQGGKQPCLLISTSDRQASSGEAGFSGYTKGCSPLPRSGAPNVLSATVGEGKRETAVFGMAFSPKVATADLEFGSGEHRRVRLRSLTNTQQRNAGVRPFRYGAFAVRGNPCLRQVTGVNAKGNAIYRGPSDDCPEAGSS